MIEHCDFDEQHTLVDDDRRMRPDVIVRLPGGKHVVIDAKAPLDAYLRALEAPDETARQRAALRSRAPGAPAPQPALDERLLRRTFSRVPTS